MTASSARHARRVPRAPLQAVQRSREICLELADHARLTARAIDFFQTGSAVDAVGQAARLADQFMTQNAAQFRLLDVRIQRDFDGRDVLLNLEAGNTVGAVPLVSPLTSRSDFGLVVQPRFPWAGIGPMLAEMGWLIAPTPLRLPLLRRSERRVPPWVLSVMVLARLQALLDRLERRFELVSETRPAPKGAVDWTDYLTRKMTAGRFLSVPCTFPDLRDDRNIKAAIRFAIEKQLRSLQSQHEQGSFVHRLIALAESLLRRVHQVTARRPHPGDVDSWLRRPLRTPALLDGLQAIDWTVEERGLAGVSDLDGIPWNMPMDAFFEAWVETVMRVVSRATGAVLKTGRREETRTSIDWHPTHLGTQRSLVPDLMLESERATLIIDAKYKRHWEEMQGGGWPDQDAGLREQHRNDLLQVLAYANLAPSGRDVICCLVYPCFPSTWQSLRTRGRLFHRAELPNRGRNLQIWLTAVPMGADAGEVAAAFSTEIFTCLA